MGVEPAQPYGRRPATAFSCRNFPYSKQNDTSDQWRQLDLNQRPRAYESPALPLSYSANDSVNYSTRSSSDKPDGPGAPSSTMGSPSKRAVGPGRMGWPKRVA